MAKYTLKQVAKTDKTLYKQYMSDQDTPKFICPNDGEISQDDVIFLCNTCSSQDVKNVDGVFVCTQCETATNPLECRTCGSKEVHMHSPHMDLPTNDHPHKKMPSETE